jgi:hypothetical protein
MRLGSPPASAAYRCGGVGHAAEDAPPILDTPAQGAQGCARDRWTRCLRRLVLYASLIILMLGIGLGIVSGLRPGVFDTGTLVMTPVSPGQPSVGHIAGDRTGRHHFGGRCPAAPGRGCSRNFSVQREMLLAEARNRLLVFYCLYRLMGRHGEQTPSAGSYPGVTEGSRP